VSRRRLPRADDDNDAVLFEKIKSGNYDADDPIWWGQGRGGLLRGVGLGLWAFLAVMLLGGAWPAGSARAARQPPLLPKPSRTPHHPPTQLPTHPPTHPPSRETVSPEGKDIVKRLLTVDAGQRLSAQEALAHPWVAGRVFEGDEGKGARQGGRGEAARAGVAGVHLPVGSGASRAARRALARTVSDRAPDRDPSRPRAPGRHQLQSTTDKLKTMAVKRESLRQQSFKAAVDAGAAGGGGSGGSSGGVAAAVATKEAAPKLLESTEEGE
jgi:hypothetical protein